MKLSSIASLFIATFFLFAGCSTTNVESTENENVLCDQIGTLSWNGSPALDGTGMLFTVGDIQYGAPGTPDDYSEYFDNDEYEVTIKADFELTGEETVRGWGTTFPEIEFITIERF